MTQLSDEIRIEDNQTVITERFANYLGDESKLRVESVRGISFPKSVAELVLVLKNCSERLQPVRISGARTGIAGAAVPEPEDVVVSLERIKGITVSTDQSTVRVGAGVTLHDLNQYLAENHPGVFFPVDPTEVWAAIGGMASTNASGARTYHYGPMRDWVEEATVVLVDGSTLELKRGRDRYSGGVISRESEGVKLSVNYSAVPRPATKCTAGYFVDEQGDLLDLFIGAEGTLGVFAELVLKLAPLPPARLVYLQIFPTEEMALSCVEALRSSTALKLLAIEFIDRVGLNFVRESAAGAKTVPAQLLGENSGAALSLEIEVVDDDALGEAVCDLEQIVTGVGADFSKSFAGTADRDMREIKIFRHAVPEGINALIARRKERFPRLHKVATDMAVPNQALKQIYNFYLEKLAEKGLEYSIFGHAGNNHFHVNIMPRNEEELLVGKELYQVFAEKAVLLGGSVAAEHGIGRLKKNLLLLQYEPQHIAMMQSLRGFFDPHSLLNKGVLFDVR